MTSNGTSWGAPDRRIGDRFPIERDIRFKLDGRESRQEPVLGKTINMSSTGVLFSTEAPVPPGRLVEVSISWPVRLNGECPLKLVAKGRVVRCNSKSAAIRVQRYEFRTAGSSKLALR